MKLATEGVKKIAIHYRTGRSDAETTVSLIEAAGASGALAQGDVADAVVAENLMKDAAQKLGGCDIFVQSVCPPMECNVIRDHSNLLGLCDKSLTAYLGVSLAAEARHQWRHGLDVPG